MIMEEIFNYYLPKELIAQYPIKDRGKANLLIINRKTGEIIEKIFENIVEFLNSGDVLVLNDAKVIPARLYGKKETGGKIEIFLLNKKERYIWEVLLRGNIKIGQKFFIDKINGIIIEKTSEGSYLVKFNIDNYEEIKKHGEIPLPPYIKRKPNEEDEKYYQTIYAKKEGALAAPTAGLHFTKEILENLKDKGVEIVYLTLYIGWASFRLIKKINIQNISIPEEFFEIPQDTADKINTANASGKKIFAVGTSCVRALESSIIGNKIVAKREKTNLFIKQGFNFKIVNGLITNFHLPNSTHLYLVCAFGGTNLVEKAYKLAIEKKYRFYSYGDAMLII